MASTQQSYSVLQSTSCQPGLWSSVVSPLSPILPFLPFLPFPRFSPFPALAFPLAIAFPLVWNRAPEPPFSALASPSRYCLSLVQNQAWDISTLDPLGHGPNPRTPVPRSRLSPRYRFPFGLEPNPEPQHPRSPTFALRAFSQRTPSRPSPFPARSSTRLPASPLVHVCPQGTQPANPVPSSAVPCQVVDPVSPSVPSTLACPRLPSGHSASEPRPVLLRSLPGR